MIRQIAREALIPNPALNIPSGIAIFGSDDQSDTLSMIYFDERSVSRRYEATIKPRLLQ